MFLRVQLHDSFLFLIFFLMRRQPPRSTRTDTLFPNTTLFQSVVVICTGICQHRDTMNQTDDKVVPRTGSSPFRTVREREVERAEKRQAVLVAAVRMFNERGFHETSLDDVAARLGVTKPGIGRAWGRERGSQNVAIQVVAV